MYRSIKMRVEPDAEQRAFLDASIEVNRIVYNGLITYCKLYFSENGCLPSSNQLNNVCTQMWQNHECFHSVYQNTMNHTSKRVLQAFSSCNPEYGFKSRGRRREDGTGEGAVILRSPRYRKQRNFDSFGYLSNKSFRVVEYRSGSGRIRRGLKLGKMGGILRCYNQSTPIGGVPKTVTITRRYMGTHYEYFATIQYE